MPKTWYVATDGDANNPGTEELPLTLQKALSLVGVILGGDTILVKGGTHTLTGSVALIGEPDNLITIRPYNDEVVYIDGSLSNGQYCSFWDFVCDDRTSFAGGRESALSTDGLNPGMGCEYYYCHIKNHGHGFAGGNNFPHLLHGCIGLYNGNDTDNGHNYYIQHEEAVGYMQLINCLSVFPFGYGFHLYGSHPFYNVLMQGCVSFQAGVIRSVPTTNFLLNGNNENVNIELDHNYSWFEAGAAGAGFRLYGNNDVYSDIVVTNNVMQGVEALRLTQWTGLITQLEGNQIYGITEEFDPGDYPLNTYGTQADKPDEIILIEDTVRPTRATCVIYNMQAQANTVAVDVSAVFGQSGTVKAHNVQDYFVDIQVLTITAGIITVNMQAINRTVETPVGWAAPDTTFPSFGCMILVKQ